MLKVLTSQSHASVTNSTSINGWRWKLISEYPVGFWNCYAVLFSQKRLLRYSNEIRNNKSESDYCFSSGVLVSDLDEIRVSTLITYYAGKIHHDSNERKEGKLRRIRRRSRYNIRYIKNYFLFRSSMLYMLKSRFKMYSNMWIDELYANWRFKHS